MVKDQIEKAKEEIRKLQEFVELAESYRPDTPERHIIREYAFHNSMPLVIKNLNKKGILKDGAEIIKKDVIYVLNSKPKDELHRIIQSWYKRKISSNKKQYSGTPKKPRRNRKLALLMALKNDKK